MAQIPTKKDRRAKQPDKNFIEAFVVNRAVHGGKRMWPSLETASRIADWANVSFIASLVIGVVSTILIVWMANVKETHWDSERMASAERIAQLNNETARLRDASVSNAEATLAVAQAGRDNAIAAQSILTTAETLALAQGFITKERAGEATRVLFIVSKLTPFSGKQFAATSSDLGLEAFLGSLRQALTIAGWIEVERSDATNPAHRNEQSSIGGPAIVKIHVDATKAEELWEAAEALASALKAEGIEALAEQATPENSNANAIHILIGPKSR
jgi:hypothetical protein